jgi:hypothetical protein
MPLRGVFGEERGKQRKRRAMQFSVIVVLDAPQQKGVRGRCHRLPRRSQPCELGKIDKTQREFFGEGFRKTQRSVNILMVAPGVALS